MHFIELSMNFKLKEIRNELPLIQTFSSIDLIQLV
jgi:hypothetical protein